MTIPSYKVSFVNNTLSIENYQTNTVCPYSQKPFAELIDENFCQKIPPPYVVSIMQESSQSCIAYDGKKFSDLTKTEEKNHTSKKIYHYYLREHEQQFRFLGIHHFHYTFTTHFVQACSHRDENIRYSSRIIVFRHFFNQSNHKEAKYWLKMILQDLPKSHSNFIVLHRLLSQLASVASIDEVFEIDPCKVENSLALREFLKQSNLKNSIDQASILACLGALSRVNGSKIDEDVHKSCGYFEKALQLNPNNFYVNLMYGDLLRSKFLKSPKNQLYAFELFKKAYTLRPDNLLTIISLAELYRTGIQGKNQNCDLAEALHKQAIKIEPRCDIALAGLGEILRIRCLENKKSTLPAADLFKKALEINPKNDFALCRLGMIHFTENEARIAAHYFMQTLVYNQNNTFALAFLGDFFRTGASGIEKNGEDARKLLLQAIDIDPSLDCAYVSLGELYYTGVDTIAKDSSKALEYFVDAFLLNPKNALATGRMIELFDTCNNAHFSDDKILEYLEIAEIEHPNNPHIRIALAKHLLKMDQPYFNQQKVYELLTQAATQTPGNCPDYYHLKKLYDENIQKSTTTLI